MLKSRYFRYQIPTLLLLSTAFLATATIRLKGRATSTTTNFVTTITEAAVTAAAAASCQPDPNLPVNITGAGAQNHTLLCKGFLSVIQAPYSAKGDGVHDDTAAIQACIEDAYRYRMVAFFPGDRTYLVSRPLLCIQPEKPPIMRRWGHNLWGSAAPGVKAPVLKLRDNAFASSINSISGSGMVGDGYTTAAALVNFTLIEDGKADPPSLYSCQVRHFRLDLGNNPNVSGVSMSGAQLCSIEDVIVSGKNFMAGIHGLPGSGGYTGNLIVRGGRYGIWQDEFRPNPSITNVTLSGQSEAAVRLDDARGPLVLSGFLIKGPVPQPAGYRAFKVLPMWPGQKSAPHDGALALEDGSIDMMAISHHDNIENSKYTNGSRRAAGTSASSVVIELVRQADVALHNVYVRGASTIVMNSSGGTVLAPAVDTTALPAANGGIHHSSRNSSSSVGADNSGWTHVKNTWVYTPNCSSHIFSEHKSIDPVGGICFYPAASLAVVASGSPPMDLAWRHGWGAPSALASWETPGAIDLVQDAGATPTWINSTDDDGARLQDALDASATPGHKWYGRPIFIPHGDFLLLRTLKLHGGSRLVGAGKHAATLQMAQQTSSWEGGAQSPMLVSSNKNDSSMFLSDLALEALPNARYVDLSSGRILLRDLRTELIASTLHGNKGFASSTAPAVRFSGSAAGRAYGLSIDHYRGNANGAARSPGAAYSLLEVGDTHSDNEPLHLYQTSVEHLAAMQQVRLASAAGPLMMHALKYESSLSSQPQVSGPLWRTDTNSTGLLRVFGGSGNFGIINSSRGAGIFTFGPEGSSGGTNSNVTLVALARKVMPLEYNASHWVDNGADSVPGTQSLLFYSSTNNATSLPVQENE